MFRFEGYTLDIACAALRTADRDLQLRPKSFEVLRYLLENAERIVTKKELMKAVWPRPTLCIAQVGRGGPQGVSAGLRNSRR
jgi:DNA-binding winged helix-turn-helix (wHTH) protein